MSDSKLIIEQAKVVQAQALGFLAKLYYYKSTLLNNLDEMNSNTKHILFFLKDPELTKLRAKIEKKFPALPDLTKINGYETYINQNQLIVNELTSHYQLFVEIYDFVSKIRHLLQDFRSKIHELKLKKNRTLLLLWSDLIVSYVRIYYLLSLIPEKSTILALYCASAYYKEPSKPVRYVNELKLIIDESGNVLKHLFDTFSTEQTMIIEICYELKDTLQFASNSEIIRNMNLFNPIYESNQVMTQPAYKALSPVNDTSAYQEMLTLQQYYDFIIVSFLVCPPLLFQEKNYPLLQHIADYRYSMVIYRDLSINVHYEFEKIQTFYEASPSSFVVTIAKGFKLKSQLKQLSRTSITNVALKQRSRRLILRNDLQNLNKLIVLTPGIIAPKLPMLFSAASMLKNEIIAFFQHYPSASNIPYLRKDTKAYYKKEDYLYYDDIGHCLLELTNSIENIAVNYKAIIKPYYLEYIFQYDLPILKQLITPFQQYFPSLSSYYQNIVDTLTTFANNPDVHIGLLNDVRQEYELLIFLLSSSNMNTVIKSSGKFYETFIKYTTQFIEHSYYYDSIERFIKEFIDPYPIYWYREQYIEIFKSTLTMTTLSTANKEKINKGKSTTNNEISDITMTPNTIIAFFLPLESVLNNIEKDCIEELPSIGLSAVKLSHRFMTILSEQLMNTLKQLWDFYQRLESQYHPIEAVKRIERALDAKLKNPNATTANNTLIDEEVLPGTESEEYAEKQIYKFIYLQKYLIYLMKPFINKKKLIIFNYEYSLISFLKEQLMNFFKNRFNQIFIINDVQSNNDNSTNTDAPVPGRGRSGSLTQQQQISGQVVLHRFSSSFYKFIYGLRVMQYSFQLLDININNTILSLLSLQCHDYQKIPTIGLFYEINLTTPTALYLKPPALPPSNTIGTLTGVGTTLIQQLGRWFLSIVYAINNRNFTNTLIWVPSKNTFINVNKQKVSYGRQGGDRFENMNPFAHNFAIELFLNHEDLIYLLQIIGLNGYQYIESLLVHLVTEQLILILRIIKAEYNNIQVLQRDYCLSVNVLFNMLKPLQELFYALRMIGTALIVRQMLLDALVVVTQKTVNDLYDSLHILHNSINHWHDAPPVSSTANASNGSTKIENPAAAPANTTNTSSSSSSSEILSTFYALCHSMGIVDERDYPLTLILIKTLEQSIKSMNDLTDKDIQLLQYLPILSSGLVIISEMNEIKSNNTSTSSSNHSYPIDFHQISNDFPNNLNYHQYYQIYSNNCHIIPYTLNKLFLFVFNFFQLKKYSFDEKIIQIQSIYDDVSYLTLHHNNNGNDSNGNNGYKKSKGNNIPLEINSLQSCYLSYISKNYLHITSQILLLLSSQAIHHINTLNASSSSLFGGGGGGSITATAGNNSGSGGINGSNNIGLIQLNYSNISFNSLYALLELFIEFSPSFLKNNPAGLLEDVFPYDIIHNGLYEIALGKYNFHDRITSFIAK